jgi:hypothetical protein
VEIVTISTNEHGPITIPAITWVPLGSSNTCTLVDYYKEYQQAGITIKWSTGEDVDLRKLSRKILNAALSFKDIVSTVVAFDPTHHAASAWAVVSLGLTMGFPPAIGCIISSKVDLLRLEWKCCPS